MPTFEWDANRTTVQPEDVPVFADEATEAAWWATHDVEGPWERRRPEGLPSAEQFRVQREARRGPRRSQPVLVRLDADILDRLRALAGRKGTGYQTLLKRFVTERLYEEEKLEGRPERDLKHSAHELSLDLTETAPKLVDPADT